MVAQGGCRVRILGEPDPDDNPCRLDLDPIDSPTVLTKLNDRLIEAETVLTRIAIAADRALAHSRTLPLEEASRYRGDALRAISKLSGQPTNLDLSDQDHGIDDGDPTG